MNQMNKHDVHRTTQLLDYVAVVIMFVQVGATTLLCRPYVETFGWSQHWRQVAMPRFHGKSGDAAAMVRMF